MVSGVHGKAVRLCSCDASLSASAIVASGDGRVGGSRRRSFPSLAAGAEGAQVPTYLELEQHGTRSAVGLRLRMPMYESTSLGGGHGAQAQVP